MKASILCKAVLFLLLLTGVTPIVGPAQADPMALPPATVVYKSELHLPLTDRTVIRYKALDPTTGIILVTATDVNGTPIGLEQAEVAEHAAHEHRYGKLEPALYEHLQSVAPDELVPVVIWLRAEEPDAQVSVLEDRYSALNIVAGRPMIDPADTAAKQRVDAYLNESQAALAAYHFSLEQPIVSSLAAMGYNEVQTFSAVPNVSAALPASVILELAQREDVDTIYLGGMTMRDEIDTAAPTDHVLPVWNRGITGRGITVTVVEGDAIDYANPYLSGITRPGTWDFGTIGHPTLVAGVIASTHPNFRGIAPDANLISAPADISRDGNNANDDDALIAIQWGLQQGSRIFNNSYGLAADNQMHRLDRAFDYLARYSAITLIKSAGNEGTDQPLTTPGLGYNVVAVGGYNDRNTIVWTDDITYTSSSAVDPPNSDGTLGDREKPELAAVAQGMRSTEYSTYHTNNNSWITLPGDAWAGTSLAAPQVAGLAALLMERQPSLTYWPETVRAILMASAFHNIEGDSRLSEIDGAGGVDMLAADETARNHWFVSTYVITSSFDAGGYLTYTIPVSAGEKVRAAICWDSNPASDYGTDPLDADLDLIVNDPDGNYVASSMSFDNNYEVVEFTANVTGDYALRVFRSRFDGSSEWLGVAWAKRTLIITPYDEQPAYAGAHDNPGKIIIRVVRERPGLNRNDFQVHIGGIQATVNVVHEGEAEYVIELTAPNQLANGLYDLGLQVNGETDISSNSVQYADTNNVDVDLVIDRSGSMGTDKMNAAKDAAKQFVDLMQTGDMVGAVSFDDVVETNFPLTTIEPPSPMPPVFSDDMESGTGNWSADAPWALTTASSHSPSHAWTDSPGGNYDNNVNISLQTASPINVSSAITTPVLSFWQRYELESGYDRGYVEVSTDGGSSWTSLANFTGTNLTWHKVELDLSAYKGQSVFVRFRLSTDYSVTRDGWYIDDVTIGQSTADTKTLAKSAIDSLYSRGMTSIGGGLQRGQEQLSTRGNANHPWAIVLLSDGLENTAPYVADVLPTIKASKTVVHTIGLGSDADEALMLDIASQTGGTYHFAPTPEELSGIYNTISGAVADRQTLLATTGVAQQGVTDQIDVVVDSTVSEATFSVSWSNSSNTIDLTLRKPNGDIIDPTVAASDPNIEYVAGSTYRYYRIEAPTLVAGVWQMRITGGSISAAAGKGVIATTSGEPYVARVTARASLTMRFYLGRDDYLTMEPAKLIVTLSDNQPILGATVTVEVEPPSQAAQAIRSSEWIEVNGDTVPDPAKVAEVRAAYAQSTTSVTLYDDGMHDDGAANDGVYANTFSGTYIEGTYVFSASASGTSNTGEAFARQAELSTYIAQNPFPNINVQQVTTDPSDDRRPAIAHTNDDKLWVVWYSYRSGNADLWYKTSSDGGVTWSSAVQLTTAPEDDYRPAIAQTSDGKIWVLWDSWRTDHPGIWYKTSTDGGASWSPDAEFTTDTNWDWMPVIAQTSDGTIWVARTSWFWDLWNFDIWYRTSNDGGVTWSADQQFTRFTGWDEDPGLAALPGDQIALVWSSDRAVNYDIWFGIIGVHGDVNPPPHLDWIEHEPGPNPDSDDTVTVRADVSDETGIASVILKWWVDGTPQADLTMYDDGAHDDYDADDDWYGVQIGPFPAGTVVEYQVEVADIDGNIITAPLYPHSFEVIELFVKTADILFVPDYGGNDTGWFRGYYEDALAVQGYRYDVWDTGLRGEIDSATLNQYTDGAVIWAVPYSGFVTDYDSTRNTLQSFLDNGGNLFITGQDIGFYTGGTSFYQDYLHASYVQDDTDLYGLNGVSGDPISDGLYLAISGGDGANNQAWPSEIDPITPAVTIFTYDPGATMALAEPVLPEEVQARPEPGLEEPHPEGRRLKEAREDAGLQGIVSSGTGAIRVDTGTYKVVYFAFGFEGINAAADRNLVMRRVMEWFGLQPAVSISIDPLSTTTWVNSIFTVDIVIEAGDQPVDGAEAHIDFNPDYLTVVDADGNPTNSIIGGSALPTELQNSVDNSQGTIDYAAGMLVGTPPTGTFTLATIRFKAVAEISETPIVFSFTSPRKTDVVFEGQSILGEHTDGSVRIEAGANINGAVMLQGRPTPPDPSWSIPLTLTLHPPGGGEPTYTFALTTDDFGSFSVSGINPGSYEARVKNVHTLRNRKTVTLTSGPNVIFFGTLLEGDANDDNCINITDFSLLRTAFATCEGDDRFDPQADFNEDGCVNISDFSLLRTNFGLCGDVDVTVTGPLEVAAEAGAVSIGLVPSSRTVTVGQVFTLSIEIEAGDQPIDGAEAHLDFDPTCLRVVNADGIEAEEITEITTTFDTVLQNEADNSQGTIDYAAGVLTGEPSTGTITLASIHLKAVTETAGTGLSFVFTAPRKTDVVFEGSSVLGDHTDGNVAITAFRNRVYLPLMLKSYVE